MEHLNKVSHYCNYCDRWNLCEYVCLLLFKISNFSLTLTELENIHSGRHSSESDLYLFKLQRFFSTQLRCCLCRLQRFFSTQLRCCLFFFMNWASNVAYMLPNTFKHDQTETLFIFTIFVPRSRPRSIYVVSMWSNFQFLLHCHYD